LYVADVYNIQIDNKNVNGIQLKNTHLLRLFEKNTHYFYFTAGSVI